MIDETLHKPWPTRVSPEQIERERAERKARTDAAIKARQKRDAERAAEREHQRQQDAAAGLEAYKDQQRERWISATGSVAGFEAAWPAMRAEYATGRPDRVEHYTEKLRASGRYSL